MNGTAEMLDLFVSVGADRFDVTFTTLADEKALFLRSRTIPSMRFNLPGWTEKCAAEQLNLIVRPYSQQVRFIQLDDLKDIERVKPVAFMIIETSPGNHQAWVAVDHFGESNKMIDFARRLRKGTGADPSASGATRMAGTRNFKLKYAPDYPLITITHAAPGRIMERAQLEHLAAPLEIERKKPTFIIATSRRQVWPNYQRCVQGAPPNHSKEGPDISRADFTFCRIAATWGFAAEEIKQKLLELSSKAQGRGGEAYADTTARKACASVEAQRLAR